MNILAVMFFGPFVLVIVIGLIMFAVTAIENAAAKDARSHERSSNDSDDYGYDYDDYDDCDDDYGYNYSYDDSEYEARLRDMEFEREMAQRDYEDRQREMERERWKAEMDYASRRACAINELHAQITQAKAELGRCTDPAARAQYEMAIASARAQLAAYGASYY